MKRNIVLVGLLALAHAAIADEEYRTARIVDAISGSEMQAGVFGGVENANVNSITIELDGMRYTAQYQTLLSGGKSSASNFVVGTEVLAYVHEDRQLWLLREDGKPLKIRITRRELVRPD